MKPKQKLFLFFIDLFYWPLRFFFTSCQLDRVWMMQTFTGSKCKPCYCDTPEATILRMIAKYQDTIGLHKLPRPLFLRVLEPSFGTGQVMKCIADYMQTFPNISVTGFEKDPWNFCRAINTVGYDEGCPPIFTRGIYRLYNMDFLT